MEQRRLRLGDILDDYCPRERRVTNHAVVAMIEENVKQTRCTTCDAEHAYKGGRAPRRRKADTPGALYKNVLASRSDADRPGGDAILATESPVAPDSMPAILVPAAALDSGNTHPDERLSLSSPESRTDTGPPARPILDPSLASPAAVHVETARAQDDDLPDLADTIADGASEGPVHRRLIRATLPRPEGQKDARPLPEFTIRQAPARGNGHGAGHFRDRTRMRGHGGSQSEPNGNRAPASHPRHQGGRGGSRQPNPRGAAPGFRGPQGGQKSRRGRGPR